MSCPLSTRCAPTPAPTFLDSVQCWRYGDTSPLDGPSVAPGKLPAATLFVPARWLELPSVFGQMHPKETSKACCRVPCGFRRAKKISRSYSYPKKVSKCCDWILKGVIYQIDLRTKPKHKIHKTGSKHTAPWALNGMVSSCCSVRSCICPSSRSMAKPRTSLTFHGAICSGSLLPPCQQQSRCPSNAQPWASSPTPT